MHHEAMVVPVQAAASKAAHLAEEEAEATSSRLRGCSIQLHDSSDKPRANTKQHFHHL